MSGAREGVVQAAIVAYLISRGFIDVGASHWDGELPPGCPGVFWRNNTGTLRDRRGIPVEYGCVGSSDIFVVLRGGQFFWLECKRAKGGKPRPSQLRWTAAMTALGAHGVFANSIEAVKAALEAA